MTSSISSEAVPRVRKRPEERRAEILDAAAAIAIDEGLERITLRSVAERLGVRPGLITHYFPAAEDLVIEAFVQAAVRERDHFFPADGTPLARLRHFVDHLRSGASAPLARMWLNARHLSRFSPTLGAALDEQDRLDRTALIGIVQAGIDAGVFADVDAEAACTRILLAVDGSGSYANSAGALDDPVHARFVADVTEWTLGLERGSLG
ncbi:TetR/AcrR family transcriptional regulator [Microbacterium sp.]|uniref:TetR/AcrR family transcriptional regulator n=1 Tax=Microbacterium sp. TaxID=51671 RepID=UPI0025F28658|nr:TetR/AcrR family transcriptional regulator [Microbacterium sp.]